MGYNMNREVLEERARKIQEQAKLAQAGLQTMKNLQKCLVNGHTFELLLVQSEFHEILQMRLVCSTCGAQTELFENISLEMPDDEEKVGELATLGLDEIDVEAPEEGVNEDGVLVTDEWPRNEPDEGESTQLHNLPKGVFEKVKKRIGE